MVISNNQYFRGCVDNGDEDVVWGGGVFYILGVTYHYGRIIQEVV